jgi:hypothetical protein
MQILKSRYQKKNDSIQLGPILNKTTVTNTTKEGNIEENKLKNFIKQDSDCDFKMSDLTDAEDIQHISIEKNYDLFGEDLNHNISENLCNKRIIVMGYFDHKNIGDEQYKITFKYIFEKYLHGDYEITYISFDKIDRFLFYSTDIIVVGGGDILNNYFIDKLRTFFFKKPNKIIAFSVGLPYDDILINSNKLNIIDFMFIRTQQDLVLFSGFFSEDRLFYIPDISLYLPDIYGQKDLNRSVSRYFSSFIATKAKSPDDKTADYNPYFLDLQKDMKSIYKKQKIIGVMLNRHIYSKKEVETYMKIVSEFAEIIVYLVKENYHIVFLPFNTNNFKSPKENVQNDILIHQDVYEKIRSKDPKFLKNITLIDQEMSVEETFKMFDYFYATMPMRFHATLFSIYKFVPMIPIFTTKKIKNFLKDIEWNIYQKLPTDSNDIPIDINRYEIIKKLNCVLDKKMHKEYQKHLYNKYTSFVKAAEYDIIPFIDAIIRPSIKKETIKHMNTHNIKIVQLFKKLNNLALKNGILDFRYVTNEDLQNTMVEIVCFYLTGNTDARYQFGLKNKMFCNHITVNDISGNGSQIFDYNKEWKWILNDYYKNSEKVPNNVDGLFNLQYMNQKDESNVHRYGWKYVYDSLKEYNNSTCNLYLDLYVDKTFHWKRDINIELGIIPYKTDWIGFVHHTFDTSFSHFNNVELLNNPYFLESLPKCRGIFVLSKYLQTKFTEEFVIRNINVPVRYIAHPTELDVPKFTMKQFTKNVDKKILHIGGWLRDIFSFYILNVASTITFNGGNFLCSSKYTDFIKKVAIKGKHMNNYFPGRNFLSEFHQFLLNSESKPQKSSSRAYCSQHISQNTFGIDADKGNLIGNWNIHYYEQMVKMIKSVDVIEFIDNNIYDNLLTENIVFLNLVDASAVNTLIECIARNTPIIVNRHPAVVELLGEKYPLYYGNNMEYTEMSVEVNKLLFDRTKIARANKYLQKMDKSKFTMDYFVKTFLELVKHL